MDLAPVEEGVVEDHHLEIGLNDEVALVRLVETADEADPDPTLVIDPLRDEDAAAIVHLGDDPEAEAIPDLAADHLREEIEVESKAEAVAHHLVNLIDDHLIQIAMDPPLLTMIFEDTLTAISMAEETLGRLTEGEVRHPPTMEETPITGKTIDLEDPVGLLHLTTIAMGLLLTTIMEVLRHRRLPEVDADSECAKMKALQGFRFWCET